MRRLLVVLCVVMGVAAGLSAAQGEAWGDRARVSLLGEWDFAFERPGEAGEGRPGDEAWQRVHISEEAPFRQAWRNYEVDWDGADVDEINHVWYEREVTLPAEGFEGRRVFLHFEAVAYTAEVWLNGRKLGRNVDGFLPFEFDVTDVARVGETNTVRLRVGTAQEAQEAGAPIGSQWRWHGGIWQP